MLKHSVSIEKEQYFKKKYQEWEENTKPFIRMNILKNFKEFKKMSKEKNSTFHESKEYLKFFRKKINLEKQKRQYRSGDDFINYLNKDLFEDSIPAQLHSIDSISMYYSIEARAPFLSKKIFDLRNRINKNLLIQKGIAKYILRNAFKKEVPESIINQKEKIGFYLSLNETLNFKNLKITNLILNNSITKKYLNRSLIKNKIHINNLNHQEEKFIFGILNIALFLKKYK